jgi:ribosomal protein S24E
MKILKETLNPLLERKEVIFEITHEKAPTPSRVEVKEKIAGKLNADPNLIYIEKMKTKTNTWKTLGLAHVYNSPVKAKILVPKYIVTRSLPKEERAKLKEKKPTKAPAKKPAEKPPTEKPKTEKQVTEKPAEKPAPAGKTDKTPAEKPSKP